MFFNRDDDQKKLWRRLARKSVLLLAPRRIGKSLLLNKLLETAGGNNFHVISLDAQDTVDESHFIEQFRRKLAACDVLSNKDRALISDIVEGAKRIKKVKGVELGEENTLWQVKGDKLIEILSRYAEKKWMIQVDELALFIVKRILISEGDGHTQKSKQRAIDFLSWLRKYQNPAKHPHLRWIFASSVGLDTIAERINASGVLNELDIYHLLAFEPPHDRGFVERLCEINEVTMDEEAGNHLIERIGWPVPYYIEKLFEAALDEAGDEHIQREHIDRGFNELLSPAKESYFNTWRQRLDDELSLSHKNQALTILEQCARDPQGANEETLLQALTQHGPEASDNMKMLLSILLKDGYLIEDHENQRIRFRLELLREYWIRRVLK